MGHVPVAAPAVEIRTCPSVPSLPSPGKARKRANRLDQHANYSDCFKDLNSEVVAQLCSSSQVY